jgi:hypothetical protein
MPVKRHKDVTAHLKRVIEKEAVAELARRSSVSVP